MPTLHSDLDPGAPNPGGALAQSLFTVLTDEVSLDLPEVDFSGPAFQVPNPDIIEVPSLTLADLTTKVVDGAGVFDGLMTAINAHLRVQHEKGRITGAEYAQAYVALTSAALGTANQFVLQKDQARWQALLVQSQALTAQVGVISARVAVEEAKVRYGMARAETETSLATYALTKMRLSTEAIGYDRAHIQAHQDEFTLTQMMPAQLAQVLYQVSDILPVQKDDIVAGTTIKEAQAEQISYQTGNLMPAQAIDIEAATALKQAQLTQTLFQTSDILPAQKQEIEAGTATKTAQTAQITYQTAQILPAQRLDVLASTSVKEAQEGQTRYETASVLPAQVAKLASEKAVTDYQLESLLPAQVAGHTADTAGKVYTNNFLLPAQLASTREQTESHRAKTLDTRTDGTTVAGAMGIQKLLYEQQIESYVHSDEFKYGKMLIDTWITQKTMDEGLTPPTSIQDAQINTVLGKIKTNLDL